MPNKPMKPMHQDERYLLRWMDRNNQEPKPALAFASSDELERWLDKEEQQAEKAFQSRDKTEKELGREELAALKHGQALTEKDEALHEKVIRLDGERLKQEQADKQAGIENVQKRAKQAQSFTGAIKQTVGDKVQDAQEKVGQAVFQVSSWTTPGGIGLLVVLLLILAATVVPVNAAGDTRLKQFWYMLSGRAALQGRVSPTAGGLPYTDTLSINGVIGSALTSVVNSPIPQALGTAALVAANPGAGIPLMLEGIGGLLLQNQFRTNFGGLP